MDVEDSMVMYIFLRGRVAFFLVCEHVNWGVKGVVWVPGPGSGGAVTSGGLSLSRSSTFQEVDVVK